MRPLVKLFLVFARIGVCTFGGGYSMLPMFQRELVQKTRWLTKEELTDYYSVSQCIPGIIAVNTSALAGYKNFGRIGGMIAAFGIIAPSIAIILLIAAFISNFSEIPAVQSAFAGVRVCVCVLIVNTIIKLWKSAVVDAVSLLIFLSVFAVSFFTSLPAAILVIAAGLVGIGYKAILRSAG